MTVLCERCGQRPAALQVTEVKDGERREHHLCEPCARQAGALLPTLSLAHILGGLVPLESPEDGGADAIGGPACPECGWTGAQIQHTGQMGCPHCYQVFGRWVDPVVRRIHGSNEHCGKIPSRAGHAVRRQRELSLLRSQLREAVEQEEFERAAELRDRIRAQDGAGEA